MRCNYEDKYFPVAGLFVFFLNKDNNIFKYAPNRL